MRSWAFAPGVLKFRLWVALLVLTTTFLSGCGTMANTSGMAVLPNQEDGTMPTFVQQEIYGGVRLTAKGGCSVLAESPAESGGLVRCAFRKVGVIAFMAIDLPLSAIGDTLTLPITIPMSRERQQRRQTPAEEEQIITSQEQEDGW